MEYQKYIDLGFKRVDTNDSVVFRLTGYHGFYLEKNVNKRQIVYAYSGELDKPLLYIKKRNSDTYHIMLISPEAVIDLFSKNENN